MPIPEDPLLTVIMPAHNAEKYLEITLESFKKQSFKAWKLFVIDDHSNDRTWTIIKKWESLDHRIVGIQNETNLRVAKTMNKGIALVESSYFSRVDSDDVLLPDHFAKTIAFLQHNEAIDICGSQVITIDGDGNFRRKWNYETSPDWVKISSIYACPFLQSSVVMRTRVIKELKGYNPEMELIEDYELWIRALQKFKAATLPDFTIQYRIHDNNMSETNKTTILKMLESMYQSNSNSYPIDVQRLELHARMEVGEWSESSPNILEYLTMWKKQLVAINDAKGFYPSNLFKKVLDKNFTNAYLKIATQNGGSLKYRALAKALFENTAWAIFVWKRKRENSKL